VSELVSILIPAYNAERWIGETLESALAQTWPDKEIIVVDDGSTDGTLAQARHFEDRGVRVIAQANQGAAAARNTALRAARGAWLQFLDADDLLHPSKIERQLQGMPDGRRSRVLLTCRWGRFFTRTQQARFTPDALWQDLAPADWILTKFNHNRFMFPASWLVSRRLVDEAGHWNESLSFDDDGEYMCRLVAASERVRFVADAECYYRVGTSGSLSTQRSRRALRSALTAVQLSIQHLRSIEDSERTRRAGVKLLGDNLYYFHPEQPDLVDECHRSARAMGGELVTPRDRLRFRIVKTLVGRRRALQWKSGIQGAKVRARKWLDGLGWR